MIGCSEKRLGKWMKQSLSSRSAKLAILSMVAGVIAIGCVSLVGSISAPGSASADTVPPPPAVLATGPVTPADQMKKQLAAEYPGAPVPAASRRESVPLSRYSAIQSQCLTKRGFDSKVEPDGGVVTQVKKEQRESFLVSQVICAEQYPLQAKYTSVPTRSQLIALYYYQSTALTQCLETRGYSVPKAPSLANFVSGYGSPNTWQPYKYVHVTSEGEWNELSSDCPQVPEDIYDQK